MKKNNTKNTHDHVIEYVDWLTKNGCVIGKIDKYFAHVHGLLHPAVHVFVFDAKKRLILQYRSHTKKIYPRHWDTSVGGHVHAGESLEKSTQREMNEELGIRIPFHYLGFADVEDKEENYYHHEHVHYYFSLLPARMKIKPNEEFEKINFVPLEKIPAFIHTHPFTSTFLAGWKKFRKTIKT